MKKKVTIQTYLKNKSIIKDATVKKLASKHLDKARNNLITMNLLNELNDNNETRKILKLPKDYKTDDWIVTASYYAMYSAATALLAKIGYKSSTHNATIAALEHFFVKKELIEQEYIEMFKRALINKEEIEHITEAKEKREIAQYGITEETTKKIVEAMMKNAYDFVSKAELLLKD